MCTNVGEQALEINEARFIPQLTARRSELEKEVQGRNSRYHDQQEELIYRNQQDRKAEHEGTIRDHRAKVKKARKPLKLQQAQVDAFYNVAKREKEPANVRHWNPRFRIKKKAR